MGPGMEMLLPQSGAPSWRAQECGEAASGSQDNLLLFL